MYLMERKVGAKMTIDETIVKLKNEAEEYRMQEALENQSDLFWNARKCRICAEEKEQIAEWLEELKKLREENENHKKAIEKLVLENTELTIENIEIRNKSIDDISHMIKDWCYEEVPMDILLQRLTEIKECKKQ